MFFDKSIMPLNHHHLTSLIPSQHKSYITISNSLRSIKHRFQVEVDWIFNRSLFNLEIQTLLRAIKLNLSKDIDQNKLLLPIKALLSRSQRNYHHFLQLEECSMCLMSKNISSMLSKKSKCQSRKHVLITIKLSMWLNTCRYRKRR